MKIAWYRPPLELLSNNEKSDEELYKTSTNYGIDAVDWGDESRQQTLFAGRSHGQQNKKSKQ